MLPVAAYFCTENHMAFLLNRKLTSITMAAALLVSMAGGCVNQESYDNLKASNDALKARNQELMEQLRALEAAREQLLARYRNGDIPLEDAKRLIAQLEAQMAERDAKLAELNKRIEGISVGPLDEATDAALADLAGKYPNILTYDSARGMLRFTSDVTFASGSYELTSEAKNSIAALAKILKELPSAQQYDLRVVGHTDTQRVSPRPGRKFDDNLELSAFRAISVRRELVGDGLGANKVEIAGWGEFRPAVDNSATGNTPANRRVELYLVKSNWDKGLPRMPAPRTTPAKPAGAATAKPVAGAAAAKPAGTPGAPAPAANNAATIVPGAANPDLMK